MIKTTKFNKGFEYIYNYKKEIAKKFKIPDSSIKFNINSYVVDGKTKHKAVFYGCKNKFDLKDEEKILCTATAILCYSELKKKNYFNIAKDTAIFSN